MATWMTHLRIGDILFDVIGAPWLDPLCFAFGSVAPDCGTPLPGGGYEPSKDETHYGHTDDRDYVRFAREHLTGASDDRTYSFYLGYYLHIVTDAPWREVYRAERRSFRAAFDSEAAFNAAIKPEWDALDFRFLRERGAPHLLRTLTEAKKIPEVPCPFVPQDALKAQFMRAVNKYRAPIPADAPTQYITPETLDQFIRDLAQQLTSDMPQTRETLWVNWRKKVVSKNSTVEGCPRTIDK